MSLVALVFARLSSVLNQRETVFERDRVFLTGQLSGSFRYQSPERFQLPVTSSSGGTTRYSAQHVNQWQRVSPESIIRTVTAASYKIHKR